MKPSIVLIGSPMIDRSITITPKLLADNKIQLDCAYDAGNVQNLLQSIETDYDKITIGGSVTNTARIIKWVAGDDVDVTYLGAIGNDANGKRISDTLHGEGIRTRFARKEDVCTAHCTVLLHHDKRTLCTDLGASGKYTVNDLRAVPADCLKADDYVYFSLFFLRVSKACLDHLMGLERKTIIVNLGAEFVLRSYKECAREIIERATIVFGNLKELLVLCELCDQKGDNVEEVLLRFFSSLGPDETGAPSRRIFVITNGENEAMLLTRAGLKKFKVRAANVKDANGAGDAFAGGFIAKYLQLVRRARLRNAAALKVPDGRRAAASSRASPRAAPAGHATPTAAEDDDGVDLDECMRCALWAASEIVQNTGCNFDRNKSFT